MILFIGFHNSPLNLYTVKLWAGIGRRLENAERLFHFDYKL